MVIALSLRRVALLLPVVLSFALMSGCKDDPPAAGPGPAPAAPPAARKSPGPIARRGMYGIHLEAPRDWVWQEREEPVGNELIGPEIEGTDWKPYMFFEVVAAPEKTLEQIRDEAVPSLERSKEQFQLRKKEIVTHPNGYKYVLIEYANDRNNIRLVQWDIVLPMEGQKRYQIQASAGVAAWSQYEPYFAAVVDSVKLPS